MSQFLRLIHSITYRHTSSLKYVVDFGGDMTIDRLGAGRALCDCVCDCGAGGDARFCVSTHLSDKVGYGAIKQISLRRTGNHKLLYVEWGTIGLVGSGWLTRERLVDQGVVCVKKDAG